MEEIDIYHVTPVNDTEAHVETGDCSCRPEIDVQRNGNVVITHNSFDGREAVELANEILNK